MNSPSFEFIQSSKIKIHNKPISKTPFFFFLTAQTPKLPFPTKHYITTITKFQKYPKPRTLISKKFQKFIRSPCKQISNIKFWTTQIFFFFFFWVGFRKLISKLPLNNYKLKTSFRNRSSSELNSAVLLNHKDFCY